MPGEKLDPAKQKKIADLCQKICDQVKDPAFTPAPEKKELLALPLSSQGLRWVAYIANEVVALESFMVRNSLKSVYPKSKMGEIFRVLNAYSQKPEIVDARNFSSFGYNIYSIFNWYQTEKSNISLGEFRSLPNTEYWTPMLLPEECPWQDVENTFDALITMDPRRDQADFASKAAKLVWLISNINLIQNEENHLAEIVLNIVFRHHQMQPLLLKAELPPLEELPLVFPLTDFQYIFPYLFQLETMPESSLKQKASQFAHNDKNLFRILMNQPDYNQFYQNIYLKMNYKPLPLTYQELKERIIKTFQEKFVDLRILKSLLRFLPYTQVDEIIKQAIKTHPYLKTEIETQYDAAKRMDLATAPYHSRYSDPLYLLLLNNLYHMGELLSENTIAENDIQYGLRRAKLTIKLCHQLKTSQHTMIPAAKAILALPASSTGKRFAATILEAVADYSYAEQQTNRDLFHELRDQRHSTNMLGFYVWGRELVEAVGQYSILPEITATHGVKDSALNDYEYDYYEPIYLFSSDKKENNGSYVYPLKYRNAEGVENLLSIAALVRRDSYTQTKWEHGLGPISRTWQSLENVLESILKMDLARVENFKKFYALTAELVWLAGNTQPLKRGSGSFAEILLALVHVYHHLQPPVLKLEFPQLDVLDISFPLVDYQYLFPYFFEPKTIHESVRPHHAELTNLNRKAILRTLYSKPDYREHCAKEIEYQNLLLEQEVKVQSWLQKRMMDILSVQRAPLKLFDERFNDITKRGKPKRLTYLVHRLVEEYEGQRKAVIAAHRALVEPVNKNKQDYHCLRILAMTLNELYKNYPKLIAGWQVRYAEEVAKIEPVNYYLIDPPKIEAGATAFLKSSSTK